MAEVFLFLTTGFEEIEALATVDILRRGEVTLKTVSLTGKKEVAGAHQVPVIADCLFEDLTPTQIAAVNWLVVPGGTTQFNAHDGLKNLLKQHASQHKKIAAICAAPMVLGGLGLLHGKKATCYPGFEHCLTGATVLAQEAVVVDGNITTGRGPALALVFALEILAQLKGKTVSDAVAKGLLLT